MKDFFINNIVLFYELIGLLILLLITVNDSQRIKRFSISAIILLMAESIMYEIERWTRSFDTYTVARPLLSACVYSIYPIILIMLMQMLTTHALSRKILRFVLIPEIISIPIFFTSQWTHLVFYYTSDNAYMGGLFSWWPYILFSIYLVIFVVHNIMYFRKFAINVIIILIYVMLVPICGVVFYLIVEADKDYSGLFTSAILLYYVFVYIHMTKVDTLTNLFNRQSYYQDSISRAKYITGVVSIDMNDLKHFNDVYGHQAGDEAIKITGSIIKENAGSNSLCYRVGGDEFMIFYTGPKEEDIEKAIEAMIKALNKTQYRCAFGYSVKTDNESMHELIKISDERMYENKREMKMEKEK